MLSRSLRGSSNVGGALRDGSTSLASVYQLIKDVQKKYRTHEQEKKELEGIVEQDQLIVSTSKGNPRLSDLYMRPVLGSRRVQVCEHTNYDYRSIIVFREY